MLKTLKDCILKGGIKDEIFLDLSTGSNRQYRVLDIKCPRRTISTPQGLNHPGPNKMFIQYLDDGKNEYISLDDHSERDIFIEKKATQIAQLLSPASVSQEVVDEANQIEKRTAEFPPARR